MTFHIISRLFEINNNIYAVILHSIMHRRNRIPLVFQRARGSAGDFR